MKTKYVEILLDEVIKKQIRKEIISYFDILIRTIKKLKDEGCSSADILQRIIRVYGDLVNDSINVKKRNRIYKLMRRFNEYETK